MNLERLWTNLKEFRYVKLTPEGYNSTDPRVGDTDGDGVGDGSEYYGFFFEQSNLWCYYTVQMDYLCDECQGRSGQRHLSLARQHRRRHRPHQPRLGRGRYARRMGNTASSMDW